MTSPFTRLGAYIWRLWETDGVPSSSKHEPKKEEIITWATEMENLLSDAPARVGMQYKFDTGTSVITAPGAGYIRFNLTSPSPEGVTEIAISDVDKFGLSYVNLIASLDDSSTLPNRATLIIRDAAADFSAVFRVNGANTDYAGWTVLAVEWVDGSGEFVDEADIGIIPIPTGDAGGTKLAIAIFDTGTAVSAEELWRAPVPAVTTFLAGLTESFGYCVGLPAVDAAYSIRKVLASDPIAAGTEFATATIAAGGSVAVFACASDMEFEAGDLLVVRSPDPAVAGITKPNFVLVGHLAS